LLRTVQQETSQQETVLPKGKSARGPFSGDLSVAFNTLCFHACGKRRPISRFTAPKAVLPVGW